MASFILSKSVLGLLLAFITLFSISEAESSFSFTGKNASFGSKDVALYGDAKLVDGGSSVQLIDSVSQGLGRVVYNKPIEFPKPKADYIAGFSTFFSFSMSRGRDGRLGFVVFPVNGTIDHSLFEVKFDTYENFTKSGDSNVTVVVTVIVNRKFDTSETFTISNLEKKENLLLHAYINYKASGWFGDVRLSRSESFESLEDLIYIRTDFSEMLKGEDEFMVGVKTYSGNFSLHSWSLESEYFSNLHSHLLEDMYKWEQAAKRKRKKRRETIWKIVTCFVMTFGSIGLVFFVMMHIRTAFKRNKLAMVMPEECGLETKEFEHEKMEKVEVVMSKAEAVQGRQWSLGYVIFM